MKIIEILYYNIREFENMKNSLLFIFILGIIIGCKKESNPIESDTEKPVVTISSPIDLSYIKSDSTVIIKIGTIDNFAINQVVLYMDDINVKVFTISPYQYQWKPTNGIGMHSIYATATDQSGNVGQSNKIMVTVFGTESIPSTPQLLLPENKSKNISTTPTLVWGIANVATSYNLQVATDTLFTNSSLILNENVGNSTNKLLTNLINSKIYFWRIAAKNNYCSSSWSIIYCFTTMAEDYLQLTMVNVAAGTFLMGANSGYPDEQPIHSVAINGFYISKYEVTQKLWIEVMGNNPSYNKGNNLPVENVGPDKVQQFITSLNQKTGKNYRLPTEAEWEFAARGGNASLGYTYSGSNTANEVTWFANNTPTTQPVGLKKPNELGLYDMSGNVWEWCSDWYNSDYYSISPTNNPQGPSSGTDYVIRGGSFGGVSNLCRSASRDWHIANGYNQYIGFRLACNL